MEIYNAMKENNSAEELLKQVENLDIRSADLDYVKKLLSSVALSLRNANSLVVGLRREVTLLQSGTQACHLCADEVGMDGPPAKICWGCVDHLKECWLEEIERENA